MKDFDMHESPQSFADWVLSNNRFSVPFGVVFFLVGLTLGLLGVFSTPKTEAQTAQPPKPQPVFLAFQGTREGNPIYVQASKKKRQPPKKDDKKEEAAALRKVVFEMKGNQLADFVKWHDAKQQEVREGRNEIIRRELARKLSEEWGERWAGKDFKGVAVVERLEFKGNGWPWLTLRVGEATFQAEMKDFEEPELRKVDDKRAGNQVVEIAGKFDRKGAAFVLTHCKIKFR